MWPQNQIINVVFIDGSQSQKQLVTAFAPLWLADSNLNFQFFDNLKLAPEQTHIRVSFSSHTASTLGAHGDYSAKSATLLLNQLNQPDLPQDLIKRLVLHEFGHALGFEHEYRNPKWPFGIEAIDQQIELCIPKMQQLDYDLVSAKQKCLTTNQALIKQNVHSTVYDENSIMNYPLIVSLPNNQQKPILAKSELSALDKLAMRQWYPQNNK